MCNKVRLEARPVQSPARRLRALLGQQCLLTMTAEQPDSSSAGRGRMVGYLVNAISNIRAEAAAILQILDSLATSPVAGQMLDQQARPNKNTQDGWWWR